MNLSSIRKVASDTVPDIKNVSKQSRARNTNTIYAIPGEYAMSSNPSHIGLSTTEIELSILISSKFHLPFSSALPL